MKAFWIYTALRIGLFAGAFGIVFGLWLLTQGGTVSGDLFERGLLGSMAVAFLVSGVASYFLLRRQRDALSARVEDRAQRASARFEQSRSKED